MPPVFPIQNELMKYVTCNNYHKIAGRNKSVVENVKTVDSSGKPVLIELKY